MKGNRKPELPKDLYPFFEKTSKADFAEIAYSFALRLTGNDDIKEAITTLYLERQILRGLRK
jgi:hypothetical protein